MNKKASWKSFFLNSWDLSYPYNIKMNEFNFFERLIDFSDWHSPCDIIFQAVLYGLSYKRRTRDIEEIFNKRGIPVDFEFVRVSTSAAKRLYASTLDLQYWLV